MDRLLTKSEAAEFCAISVKQLQRFIDKGEIAVVSLGETTKGDRFKPEVLKAFIRKRELVRGVKPCQLKSSKVVSISSASKSTTDELNELFGATGRKRKKSKQK